MKTYSGKIGEKTHFETINAERLAFIVFKHFKVRQFVCLEIQIKKTVEQYVNPFSLKEM